MTESRTRTVDREFLGGMFRGLLAVLAVAAVLVAAAAFIVPRFMGWVPLTILSGSMEPTYSPGDVVVVDPDYDDPQVGDIITFQPVSGDSTLVTHRIIGVTIADGGISAVTTQGDNNTSVDDPVLVEQIQGEVRYHVPWVGYLTQPNVRPWLGGAAIAVLVWLVLSSVLRGRDRKDGGSTDTDAKAATSKDAEPTAGAGSDGTAEKNGAEPADLTDAGTVEAQPADAGPAVAASRPDAEAPADASVTGTRSGARLDAAADAPAGRPT